MISIIDFGSQYTQLIARRLRSLSVYCEVFSCKDSSAHIIKPQTRAIILSGGPSSVTDVDHPVITAGILESKLPILGICYGFQVLSNSLGGIVKKSHAREYGESIIKVFESQNVISGDEQTVWMSHGDEVATLPDGFVRIASTENCLNAAAYDIDKKYVGLQFHPEVSHTIHGLKILESFLDFANVPRTWTTSSFIEDAVRHIRETVGDEHVLCALSGGVDSAVAALLIRKAIGENLKCVFVDNGLLRHQEREAVETAFREHFGDSLTVVDAADSFLYALKDVTDPEAKRKIIGNLFVETFEVLIENSELSECKWLAQGTLYPDVIESISFKGPSAVIKSHHNVGGLPERMNLKLLEPLRMLFKDEVRELGRQLGLPDSHINRQPFPGPGLAIRVIGSVDENRLSILRKADQIVRDEVEKDGLTVKTWQAFACLLPVKTVGVMGDERTYEHMCLVRIVNSDDGMTADVPWPTSTLTTIAARIVSEVRGINRVVYDITSKPPGTIELE